MNITSSTIEEDDVQADGRRHILEVHTDSAGTRHEFRWVAVAGQDVQAVMTARAAELPALILRDIEQQEFARGIHAI